MSEVDRIRQVMDQPRPEVVEYPSIWTPNHQLLWDALKAEGYRFKKEEVIGGVLIDMYLKSHKLGILLRKNSLSVPQFALQKLNKKRIRIEVVDPDWMPVDAQGVARWVFSIIGEVENQMY